MRKETHKVEGSTEFDLNASFIFFKLIYNIIDFGAIVKGDARKIYGYTQKGVFGYLGRYNRK